MSFSIFEILLIIGLVQGLITSGLLLSSRDKQLGKRILGFTVMIFCIAICRTLLHSMGLWDNLSFRYFPVGMELLLPPLVYLYVCSLTEDDFSLKWRQLIFFIPGLFYAVYDISLYLWVIQLDSFEAKREVANLLYFNQLNEIEDFLIVIVTMVFVYLGFRRIAAYLNWLKQFKEHQSMPIYKWLKSIIKWSALLGLVLMFNELMDTFSLAMDIQNLRWRFFNLFLAFVTYYLGFMGYRQDGLKVHESKILLKNKSRRLLASDNEEIETQLLIKLDRECIYLEPELTLKKLATDLSISSENISAFINQKYEISFRDLINQYRVKHFKSLVGKQSNKAESILTMALDSGFNSQASFYRAFKKFEGMSPKEYISLLY